MTGTMTVARLEVILRFRAGRWRWLLGSWFLGLVAFSWLLEMVIDRDQGLTGHRGAVLFGGLQLFMLALALFIVPALTSQSINGDRERGRLGVLQVSELSAFDIIAGKLLAAWGTASIFVAVSAPMAVWALVQGGVTVWQVLVVTVVMVLLLGIICAIGLGLSALLARSTTSSVLTYVAVFVLAVGTLVLTALISAVAASSGDGSHPDHAWIVLSPNPFVILADAAPATPVRTKCYQSTTVFGSNGEPVAGTSPSSRFCETTGEPGDVLGSIRTEVRQFRSGTTDQPFDNAGDGGPVWPYGLAIDLVVAGALLTAAVRRIRTPVRHLPRGVRLA
jgi:ABC-type transport system involved in multi-copper enzyme maturation permease subunit